MYGRTAITFLMMYGMLAHHGGTGAGYDMSRPLYLRGRIIQARYGYPHGTMRIEVPANLTVPSRLPNVQRLRGYENWEGPPVPEGAGQVRDLLLSPDVTGELANMRGAPGVGDEISVVAYQRCYDEDDEYSGEIRVQMLYAGSRSFRYRGTFTRFVDRCAQVPRPSRAPSTSAPAPGASAPSAPATTGSSAPVATRSGDDPPYLLLGGGAAVAVGFVAALIRLRMRRANGGSAE